MAHSSQPTLKSGARFAFSTFSVCLQRKWQCQGSVHCSTTQSCVNTSSRSRVSAMNLVSGREACLKSATTDAKLSFSCFLLWSRQSKSSVHLLQYPHPTCAQTHSKSVGLHVLVQTKKVIYEVHHFCCAELWGESGLSVHWEHDQMAAMLIKSTCADRQHQIEQGYEKKTTTGISGIHAHTLPIELKTMEWS